MKRILSFLSFGMLFRPKDSNIRVTDTSQSHRLTYAMAQAGLAHGDRVIADVGPIQFSVDEDAKTARAYMCNIRSIQVKERVAVGDHKPLPMQVTFKGINVIPQKGINYYKLKNVTLYSNGTIQVIANADTVIEQCSPY
jgi:hypothetical protein